MSKYTGNSYYLISRIISLMFFSFLLFYVICQPKTPDKVFYGGLLLISLFLFFVIQSLKNLLVVRFNDSSMNITYLITQKKAGVPYSKILKWECIDGQRGHHINVVCFKSDNFLGTRKIKIDRIVTNDKFIPFLKWLKTKNNKIQITITPSDSKLIKPFEKEFGYKNDSSNQTD